MASSMKAAIHLGPDFLMNSETFKNTRFENIERHHSKINRRTFRRKSECERPSPCLKSRAKQDFFHHHHGRDQHWSTIKRSNRRRQKLVSTLISFYVLVGWNKVKEQKEDGKAKLKISGCIHHIKMLWESMEKQLNSSGKFPRIFDIVYSS